MAPAPAIVDYNAHKQARSRSYETAFLVAMGVYLAANLLGMATGLEVTPLHSVVCASLITAMHGVLRLLPPGLRAPRLAGAVVFVDCVLISIVHPEVIGLFWKLSGGKVGLEAHPYPFNHNWGMRTTFVYYCMLSYLANFVLLLQQVRVVVPAAVSVHCVFLVSSCLLVRPDIEVAPMFATMTYLDYVIECLLLCFASGMMVLAKRASERSDRQLFEVLEQRRSQFMEEKALRFQAEFMIENMKERSKSAAQDPNPRSLGHSSACTSVSGPTRRSALTAPARFCVSELLWPSELEGCCVEMDCLPPDAVACVEGSEDPQELQHLEPGSRVLCYDSLGERVRYVDVLSVRLDQAEDVDWVDVTLANGTEMRMTADHPMRLAGVHDVLGAGNLVPEKDSVTSHGLATQPSPVAGVAPLAPGAQRPLARVSVAVRQAERHSILVSPPEHGHPRDPEDRRMMAVGSANLLVGRMSLRNTFLEGRISVLLPPGGGVTQSAPASPRQRGSEARREATGREAQQREQQQPAPSLQPEGTYGSSQSNYASSLSSPESEVGGATIVLPWGRNVGEQQGVVGRLGTRLEMQRAALPSVGSVPHATSRCHPCTWRGRCRDMHWCRGCHLQHRKARGRLFPPPEREMLGGTP